MDEILLRNAAISPDEKVLSEAMQKSYAAYKELLSVLQHEEVQPEWRFYRDGKAWLCKMNYKKKNLGWLYVYDGYFGLTFYFTEKHREKIAALSISEPTKEAFGQSQPTGKLIPMIFHVHEAVLPQEIITVLRFKKSLK